MNRSVIGVGSPVVDLLCQVPEETIGQVGGAKGGMELIDAAKMNEILSFLPSVPKQAAGGSSGNTTFALATLGVPAAFLGKVGEDENGDYYCSEFKALGGSDAAFKVNPEVATACCLSLVTPDSERTMRTDLGAAMTLAPDEVSAADFEGYAHAHMEGYLLFNPDLMMAVLKAAKAAGCRISLDLGSFEVVGAAKDILPTVLGDYVDIVFANEEEAAAFCGNDDPQEGLKALSQYCEITAVKVGKDGAFITNGTETVKIEAELVENAIDTTGAGDYWAAGFLYGHLKGRDLAASGAMGSVLGAAVVQVLGAKLTDEGWKSVNDKLKAI
ncbi:MAG: adenosine kinase [Planctomycetota bacterium]|jgi:sugar/nucleoside kinase (ribokinase family)